MKSRATDKMKRNPAVPGEAGGGPRHPPKAALAAADIPVTNEIGRFLHCPNCVKDKPNAMSWREWMSIEFGLTKLGFQVWCKRCEMNVVHIDLVGQKVNANLEARSVLTRD